jgi:hypothetical protein
MRHEDLRLEVQPAECAAMDNAVAVALKARAPGVLRFGISPPAGLLLVDGPPSQPRGLPLLIRLP